MTSDRVPFFGYQDCLRLSNGETSVTLSHQCGGRILEYALRGENAIVLEPGHEGWVWDPNSQERPLNPTGGRFDVGPEHVFPRHPTLWIGAWDVESTGPLSARLTSQQDEPSGVQLIRDVTLAPSGTHLTCVQTIKNVSQGSVQPCHWARTFARGNGVGVVPVTAPSRFPKAYVQYGPGPAINFRPDDPAITRQGDFLIVRPTPQHPKLGFDSTAGWFAYLMPGDLMFVKRFPVYPDRVYNEVAAITLCIWYPNLPVPKVELEPIGPREVLAPGESATFTEEWWLVPYRYAAEGEAVDAEAVAAAVGRLT